MSEEKELTNEERAKLLFERGQKGFENNNFLEAMHYFKISNKLYKTFQTDEYIKKCEEKIKEMREKEKEEEKKEQNGENSQQGQKSAEDEACEKIINNKDYYDILGITKQTSNDDIKKAYKKLAIKFHPDKNKSPKAEEAFKKIATAYQTLTDPKKRELFDKYGSEEEYREKVYQERQQAFEEDFDAYDIFDLFFGNIDPEVLRRQRRRFHQHRAQNVQVNPKVAKFLPFLQLIPILLMGLTSILPSLFQSKDLYAFERNSDYPYEKKTHKYKISYYVGNDFREKYKDNNEIRKMESEIENKYTSYLRVNCQEKLQMKEEIQIKLMYYRKGSYYYNLFLNELNKLDFKVCDKLQKHLKRIQKNDDEEDDEYEDD